MLNVFNLLFYSICFLLAFQYLVPSFSHGSVGFRPVGIFHKLLFGLFMFIVTSFIGSVSLLNEAIWALVSFVAGLLQPSHLTPFLSFAIARTLMVQISVWLSALIAGLIMPGTIAVPSSGAAWQAAYALSTLVFLLFLLMLLLNSQPGSLGALIQ